MSQKTKLLALCLSALCVLPILAGCASDTPNDTTDADTTVSADTTAPIETTTAGRSNYKDALPDSLNFDDDTVNVFFRDTIEIYNVFGTDNEGDPVTDSIWTRNGAVEDRLGIVFNYIRSNGAGMGDVANALRQQHSAGLNEWDFIITTNNTNVTQSMDSLMLDCKKLPHLDFTQPYWWTSSMDNLSLDGSSYRYLVGDVLLQGFLRTGAFFYNKQVYENAFGDPDALYQVALDGAWTYDKMKELSEAIYNDANGSGVTDDGDTIGFVLGSSYEEQTSQFAVGFDIQTYTRNADGSITLDMGNERVFDVSMRLYELAHMKSCLIVQNNYSAARTTFSKGNVLFLPGRFDAVTQDDFRSMEEDYGILPYPKYDADQKDYVTLVHSSSGNICVLNTISENRYEIVGATIEALAAESYRSVTEPFLETALKMKYSRDALSGQVIDIIVASIKCDLIHEYRTNTNDIFRALVNNATATEGVFVSSYAKLGAAAQKSLDKSYDALVKALDD